VKIPTTAEQKFIFIFCKNFMNFMKKMNILTFLLPFLLFLAFFKNVSITSLDIKDNVFTSYIIAPILSLPIFMIFSFKEEKKKRINFFLVFAICSFLLLISLILQIYLKIKFSYLYYSFRLDLLSIAFFVAIFYLLLFGGVNLKAVIFSLLSIPLFFLPIFMLRNYFNELNILLVSPFGKIFGLEQQGKIFSKNGISIAISEECTSPSVFVAFFIFILLISYFFNASKKRKIVFITFSFLLLFVLNLIRIILILFFLSNNKIQHISGVPFFYLGIAISIFSFKKFGLEQPRFRIEKLELKRALSLLVFSILLFFIQQPKIGASFEELENLNIITNISQPFLNRSGFSTNRSFQFYYINDSYVLIAPHKLFESKIENLKYQFLNMSNNSKINTSCYLLFDNFSAELVDFSIGNKTFCSIFAESYSKKGFFSIAILNNLETNESIKTESVACSFPAEYTKINNKCVILLKRIVEE
jgi:exosortase/archaeosortase family protein